MHADIAVTPGVEFVYFRGSSIYHTSRDTPDSVSPRSVQSHGVNTVALVRQLASDDLESTGGDVVFFTVGRFHLVRYPTAFGILIAAASGAVLFVAVRRRRLWTGMARGAATTITAAIVAAIVVALLWTPFAQWRDTMGVVDARTPQGVLLAWWVLAMITALAAPGMSCLFALPALVGASALLFGFDPASGRRALGPAVLAVGVAVVVLIPAIDTYFQFAQPRPGNPDSELPALVALPVLLVALAIQLALAFRPRPEHAETDDVHPNEPTTPVLAEGPSTHQTATPR